MPAGYAALIDAWQLLVPFPQVLSAIGLRHKILADAAWRIFTPRYAPLPTLAGHITFALKYEGIDLAVLKRLFLATGPEAIETLIRRQPTGSYSRRVWFLYEWLTGQHLNLPDTGLGALVDVVDTSLQWAVPGTVSRRHRVRNNLPGTPAFCPLAFHTPALDAFSRMNLATRAHAAVAAVPRAVLARAAAFLLLKDSKSSYAIEGERAPHDRIQRWGRAIGESGRNPVSVAELLRLQKIIIEDARFVPLGLRTEGVFVGEHDRDTRIPLPEHIAARPEDLPSLLAGMVAFGQGPAVGLDSVVAAAALAFGFVYVHPFADGNGRIHRYLIHHVLAQRGFGPPGFVFPISAAILDRIEDYRAVLEGYSRRLLPFIQWKPTSDGNVEVLNDTADFYRYFDVTAQAEFLYGCVRRVIEEDLPREADFLLRYDRFAAAIQGIVDMPDRTIDLLFRILHQNSGRLSVRRREREFSQLTDAEVAAAEGAYADAFGAVNLA